MLSTFSFPSSHSTPHQFLLNTSTEIPSAIITATSDRFPVKDTMTLRGRLDRGKIKFEALNCAVLLSIKFHYSIGVSFRFSFRRQLANIFSCSGKYFSGKILSSRIADERAGKRQRKISLQASTVKNKCQVSAITLSVNRKPTM